MMTDDVDSVRDTTRRKQVPVTSQLPVSTLLRQKTNTSCDLDVCDAFSGRYPTISKFINRSNVSLSERLHVAAMVGSADDVQRLLEAGADVLTSDGDGCTPLHSAAQSAKPSCEVASLLLDALKKKGDHFADCLIDRARNTPLHIAAGNVNVSADFIGVLFALQQHRALNDERDTPFHIAAKSDNPDTVVALLKNLIESRQGCSIDDLDGERRILRPDDLTLIELAAIAGNAEAVGLMIQNGADIGHRLLHIIITESVRDPSKADRLTKVYQAVVDYALHWRSLHQLEKFPVGQRLYFQRRMQTVMYLLTRRDDKASGESRRNVLEHAIAVGAHQMLHTIVNTENVFRFSDNPFERSPRITADDPQYRGMWYIITNFVRSTESPDDQSTHSSKDPETAKTATENTNGDFDEVFKPKRPYMTSIVLENPIKWRKTNVLLNEPFRELTRPFVKFVQRIHFVLALVQFLYMVLFAVFCSPTACSLSERFNEDLPGCNYSGSIRGEEGRAHVKEFPGFWWLIWPCVMLLCGVGYLSVAFVRCAIEGFQSPRPKVVGCYATPLDPSPAVSTPIPSDDSESIPNFCIHSCSPPSTPLSIVGVDGVDGVDEVDGNYVSQRPSSVHLFNRSTPTNSAANVSGICNATAKTCTAVSEQRPANRRQDISITVLVINLFPLIGFSVAIILWYIESGFSVPMTTYVQTTSMVFLFGWTTGFVFFSGIKREFYLFSLVLREFIAKDVCYKFVPLFFFTVLAYSFSVSLLQQLSSSPTSVGEVIYDLIIIAVAADPYEQTTDREKREMDRPWFLRVVLTVYVYWTAVILLNVLIAMMNHRYDDAKVRAEREWRFWSVEIAMTIQDNRFYRWITRLGGSSRLPFCRFLRCAKRYQEDNQQFLVAIIETKDSTANRPTNPRVRFTA